MINEAYDALLIAIGGFYRIDKADTKSYPGIHIFDYKDPLEQSFVWRK